MKKVYGILVLATMLTLSGCTSPYKSAEDAKTGEEIGGSVVAEAKAPEANETAEKAESEKTVAVEPLFTQSVITDEVYARINGKSFKEDGLVPRSDLVYLQIAHIGFDGETHEGEMIVNQEIAEDVLDIFRQLYEAKYPIEKMQLIDNYAADDEASMSDNNTSAFNYRNISHSSKLSNHSYGKAIDINPKYNPYVKTVDGELSCEPDNAREYMDREKEFPHKITADDLCCQLFKEHGFTWGGDWEKSKDYQHFEK